MDEFRFVLTGSGNIFIEESNEGWHDSVFVPISSAVLGRQSYSTR